MYSVELLASQAETRRGYRRKKVEYSKINFVGEVSAKGWSLYCAFLIKTMTRLVMEVKCDLPATLPAVFDRIIALSWQGNFSFS